MDTYNIHAINNSNNYSNISTINTISRDSSSESGVQYFHNPNQTLKGEIIDLKNNDIVIRLDDGTKIEAKIYDTSNLNIGQIIKFKVQETESGLVIENFETNQFTESSMIFKALEAANLPANERNISIVTELLKNNMSLDKQTILNIQRQSFINKDIHIDTLVLLNKHNIPVNSSNAEQFNKYRNYEHRIVKEIDSIAKNLPNVLNEIIESDDISNVLKLNNQLINIVNNSTAKSDKSSYVTNPLVSSAFLSPTSSSEVVSILENYKVDSSLLDNVKNGTATLREVASTILKCLEVADELDSYRVSTLNAKNANAFTNISLAKDAFTNPTIQTILEKYASLQRDNSEVASFMNNYNRAQLISKLRDVPGSMELTDKIWSGNISSNDLLSAISSLLSNAGESAVRRLLKSSQYKSVISETLLNSWTLSPNDLLKDNAIEDNYRSMYEQLSKLDSFIQENNLDSNAEGNLSRNFKGTQENIDFMDTLNSMFTYVQIPLKLRNQNIHSDLYVMTSKKSLMKNKNNISVLLHLDMEYLGSMDINLVVSDNNISTTFNVTDQETLDLLSTNMEHLEYSLMEKGFLLNSNVLLKDKTVDLIDNFISKDSSTSSIKRYTFDIRT